MVFPIFFKVITLKKCKKTHVSLIFFKVITLKKCKKTNGFY